MKRITFALIFALIFSFCLVYASAQEATISDDLSRIYIDGITFVRFDASYVIHDYYYNEEYITLSDSQSDILKSAKYEYTDDNVILNAYMTYTDGAVLNAFYLREDYLPVFKTLDSNYGDYTVQFNYPVGNDVIISTDFLISKAEDVTFTANHFRNKEYKRVRAISADGLLALEKGCLAYDSDGFYYMDCKENDLPLNGLYKADADVELKAHKITDEETINKLSQARELYYDEDFGRLENEDFIDIVGAAVMIAVFGVLPALVLIFSLVFTFISKKLYRKLFILCDILCVVEIAFFIVFMGVLSV